jgi:two-component system response regulator GlrR
MTPAQILLLNFHPEGDLGGELCALLESSLGADGWLVQSSMEWLGSVPHEGLLAPGADGFEPNLILLVLAADQLREAGELLRALKRERAGVAIVVAAETCEPAEMLRLLQDGAADFLTPPISPSGTLPRVWRLLEQSSWRDDLTQTLKERIGLKGLIGRSANFVDEIKKIPLVARSDGRVLITGETGTGKELCARAIHYLSPRRAKPFVPINCGAIPVELVENELFGHERGAYTGALVAQAGLIQEAEGGTLFLDEIDCLPLMAQTKLLRFLQEREYRPLGSARARSVDVRVVAASNTDLEEAVRTGRMRRDLYYRLNVVPLVLPPLRERREDIPLLARHFLLKYAAEFGRQLTELAPDAMRKLVFYDWPGNVRELEHIVERAVMLCATSQLTGADISLPGNAAQTDGEESFRQAKARIVAQFEKSYIQRMLVSFHGNISEAARAARKNRRAFWQLIRKHRIDVRRFKLGTY